MITNAYEVKKAHGEYDGISATQPDATFDSNSGYSVDFRLLVEDGTNWTCTDATPTAAVWVQDTSKDTEIDDAIRALTESVCIYLDNWFVDKDYRLAISNLDFQSPNLIEWTDAAARFTDYFLSGDTLWITGSRRNDAVYDIDSLTDTIITTVQDIRKAMVDATAVYLHASSFPQGLMAAAGRMGAYDVWDRSTAPTGVTSESIGSYSYSLEEATVNGIPYPEDLVSGLNPWRRPKIR